LQQTGWRRTSSKNFFMSTKGSTSASRQMNAADLSLESTKRRADYDRAKLKKLKITSPDTSKMHSVTYGGTTYYFKNKKKLDKFLREDKHHEILGVAIPLADQHKPNVNERFNNTNQKIDDHGSEEL